jgi:N-acetylmuramoyl-L-alanine amidase
MVFGMMGKFFFLNIFFAFLCFPKPEAPVAYLEIAAKEGEGVYALLRRFHLMEHSCNLEKFYEINKLKKNASLIKGKTYLLPVAKHVFDGKSIRSSLGIKDFNQALSIQQYNEAMLSAGLRLQPFQKDKDLWVPHHLLFCPEADKKAEPLIPADDPDLKLDGFSKVSNPGKRQFPIFGEKYAYTPLQSKALEGRIYYLISGHGGPDPGAMAKRAGSTLCEDEYAYDVTLRLCRKLIQQGASAYMIVRDPNDGIRSGSILTCDDDEIVWGGSDVKNGHKPRLSQRTDIINELYEKNRKLGFSSQQVIEIHVDSRSQSQQVDLFFYYQEGSEKSQTLAEDLHQTIRGKYRMHRANGNYQGTVSTRNLHTLRESKPPTVYIELGNIRNGFDQQRVVLESNREALANWLLEGLKRH